MIDQDDYAISIQAEQSVLGALMIDNDAIDRCNGLQPEHFFRHDHRLIFTEMLRQIGANQRMDAITLFEKIGSSVDDCLRYLASLRQSAASAANIRRHADIVLDKAQKRALAAIASEAHELASSAQPAAVCIDLVASKLDALTHSKVASDPKLIGSMMVDYLTMIQDRVSGAIRPISTGHEHLDEMMDGGFERGTLTVVAARPGMGKTAFGLGIARNVSETGSALFLSMEMASGQVNDRNISAIGKIPLQWLRQPKEDVYPGRENTETWERLTFAVQKTQNLKLHIDDQTGLNMLEIRAKSRKVRRQSGLDLVVVDQLSFITGGTGDKSWELVGQYTRGLIALAKELDCAVMLLCQLNRECEKRGDQRPIMSDLAMSGSIEQDAANIIFLYRDDIAKKLPRDQHTGICEVQSVKQRQGEPGTIGLAYIGNQTRFEDLPYRWERRQDAPTERTSRKGGFS